MAEAEDPGPEEPEEDLENLPPVEVVVKKPSRLSRPADFPSRVSGSTGNSFVGPGATLEPHACQVGAAGRQPRNCTDHAAGCWRGRVEATGSQKAAASLVAPLLAGTVRLQAEGVLIATAVEPSSLRFLRADGEGPEVERVAEVLAGAPAAFRLAGRHGQVLSHCGDLWTVPLAEGGFDALLRLRPRATSRNGPLIVVQEGPLGPVQEVWEEVPMVELPRLLRLMVDKSGEGIVATTDRFLVEEEDEILVLHCWRRKGLLGEAVGDDGQPLRPECDPLSMEELLWYDTVSALGETAPCAEAPVPASRLRFTDEGVVSQAELLDDQVEAVKEQDAARLGSVAFLRQYVKAEILKEEVLPRLLPSGSGSSRILSAELAPTEESSPSAAAAARPKFAARPKTLDDLFSDEADYRKPAAWLSVDAGEDPLAQHELTSVFLASEAAGFILTFHCLQAVDPCAL